MSWVEFPKLTPAKNKVMSDVAAIVEKEIGSLLNTSELSDVRSYRSENGVSQGAVTYRTGKKGSKVRFVLGSWIHSSLPFGPLNITTVQAVSGLDIDAPHLIFDLIQTGYNSLLICLDHVPRKDVVLEPEYLKRFYVDAHLEDIRSRLVKLSQSEYYTIPSLYLRSIMSPTSIFLTFNTSGEEEMDALVQNEIYPQVIEAVNKWFIGFKHLGKPVTDKTEMSQMRKRDEAITKYILEIDLKPNLPRLFDQDTADQIVGAYCEAWTSTASNVDET